MTAERYAMLLLHGELEEVAAPGLDEPAIRRELEERLAACGLQIIRRAGHWSAIATDAPADGDRCTWKIDADEAIILLVFLALLRRADGAAVERTALLAAIVPRLWTGFRIENVVLPRLLNRRLLREDGPWLRPGPRFAAIDTSRARDHLAEFASLIEAGDDA